jgi:hypothetical protein
MLGLIALIVEIVGLACDITGATIIALGIRVSREEARKVATADSPIWNDEGDRNSRLEAALYKQGRDAMKGLKYFIAGFLGQALGAFLAYLAK